LSKKLNKRGELENDIIGQFLTVKVNFNP